MATTGSLVNRLPAVEDATDPAHVHDLVLRSATGVGHRPATIGNAHIPGAPIPLVADM